MTAHSALVEPGQFIFYTVAQLWVGASSACTNERTTSVTAAISTAPGAAASAPGSPQQLFAAFLFAAANIRKMRSFLERAQTDDNGDLYVVRTLRTGAHARTGAPPGAAAPGKSPPGATAA